MDPSTSVDNDPHSKIECDALIQLLNEQDEETAKLLAEEKERQEKAKDRAKQTSARTSAETLAKQLLKHASNIRGGIAAYTKNGKVTVKAKNACGASLWR